MSNEIIEGNYQTIEIPILEKVGIMYGERIWNFPVGTPFMAAISTVVNDVGLRKFRIYDGDNGIVSTKAPPDVLGIGTSYRIVPHDEAA